MINEKLLSEILGENIVDVEIIDTTVTAYYMQDELKNFIAINIHELAHKCKEWAFEQGWEYILNSHRTIDGKYYRVWLSDSEREWFANTEPEAISKACKWILKDRV